MKILVLSPHADDAIFSCFDHIKDWIHAGHTVHVCTIFSKFTPSVLGSDVRGYMANSGYTDARKFEKARQNEDRNALRYLGVKYITPGFIDGAFQSYNGKGVYPTFGKLFSGCIAKNDRRVHALAQYIQTVSTQYDRVISPIGIGSQADHVITNACAERHIERSKVSYYYDIPYYFFTRNWKRKYISALLRMRISLRWITQDKIRCMNLYGSQIGLIIRNNRRLFFREGRMVFPEIVVSLW